MQEDTLLIKGRHDPCILSRASVVIESAAALSILEALE
ncbi:MAG: chorismate synthase [Oscillospiraceae bacterium]